MNPSAWSVHFSEAPEQLFLSFLVIPVGGNVTPTRNSVALADTFCQPLRKP